MLKRCVAVLIPIIILTTGCSTAAQEKPRLTLIAHRGAAQVYPESSKEAFEAVSQTGFPIETDLRLLKDGTIVPLHDATVDRTMTGITGRPETISLEDWRSAHIKSPTGGDPGTPTTWDAVLDAYGGRSILIPELKDRSIDLKAFAATITDRGIQDKVVVQTSSFAAAKTLASAGVQALYLLGKGQEPNAAAIKESGIDYVGTHLSVSKDYLDELKAAGLTVWVYTLNDTTAADRAAQNGADGVFTDDPWKLNQTFRDH